MVSPFMVVCPQPKEQKRLKRQISNKRIGIGLNGLRNAFTHQYQVLTKILSFLNSIIIDDINPIRESLETDSMTHVVL